MPSVAFHFCSAGFHYAECCHAECRYAECRGAFDYKQMLQHAYVHSQNAEMSSSVSGPACSILTSVFKWGV